MANTMNLKVTNPEASKETFESSSAKRTRPGLIHETFWRECVPTLLRASWVFEQHGFTVDLSQSLQILLYDSRRHKGIVSLVYKKDGAPSLEFYASDASRFAIQIGLNVEPAAQAISAHVLDFKLREKA